MNAKPVRDAAKHNARISVTVAYEDGSRWVTASISAIFLKGPT